MLDAWWRPLQAALDGAGPALLPVPDGPAAGPVLAMAGVTEPLETSAALVVPTSGSTGAPKGVLLSAAALRASASATLDRLGGPGSWLLALPVTHIAGLQVLVRSVLAGTRPVCLDSTGGFDPAGFAGATDEMPSGRRYTALVPTQLRRLLDTDPAVLAGYDAVLVGGAGTPPALLDAARAAGAAVVTTYGMSETAGGCVYDGRPLAGVSVDLDAVGRIRLGGPTVFSGYRLRPDLTAEGLESADGVRRHRTADLGAWDPDGRLRVLGRADDLILTGGEQVAPALVEAALHALPAVAEAVVVGVPDECWGTRVVAAVVLAAGAPRPDLGGLRAALAGVLPRYALPAGLLVLAEIPLRGPGKPDRRAIGALAAGAGVERS